MEFGGPEIGVRGCGSNIALLYFVTFMINVSIMIMNLFVAVVIEGFTSSVIFTINLLNVFIIVEGKQQNSDS